MFRIFALIFAFCLFGNAFAKAKKEVPEQCRKEFVFLQNKREVSLKRTRTVTVTADTDLKALRRVEQQAVTDYQEVLEDQDIPEWGYVVTTFQYTLKKDGTTLGHKVEVDGGDESIVELYYALIVDAADVWDALLYFVWHNQSPIREWACEGY